ncbi:FAD/NAD(P)-binding protein, partial [Klebsiella pneumoniae]|uniref:FAD/NAD(P)-binding protein n=1 Tax=Klebsiella pneumoniae TaxID=573 RepID=UPI001EF92B74
SGYKLGFNLKGLVPRILKRDHEPATIPCYSVVIVGAGAAGISVASSLLCREPQIEILIIDPAETQ